MTSRALLSANDLISQAGQLSRTSRWYHLPQSRIDVFADATEDHQFIHVDAERVREETQFDGTIAHGFLSLSMMSAMIGDCLPQVKDTAMIFNYGFDKIRFLNPVPSGGKIRGHFSLKECSWRRENELLSLYGVSIEIEAQEKPALVADWLGLTVLKDPN